MRTYAQRERREKQMNKDLQQRAAKCEGMETDFYERRTRTVCPMYCMVDGGCCGNNPREEEMEPEWVGGNPLTDYDDWNNVMRLRDLAIAKQPAMFAHYIQVIVLRDISEYPEGAFATKEQIFEAKEQILEAAVRTLEEAT